ncbi:MAG: SDR family oxidoreductase [Bacillota bacterium]
MILVVGASGYLGGLICKELVRQGKPVRAMVRKTSETRYLTALGVDLAYADLNDPATLPPAVRGCQAVIYTATAAVPTQKGDTIAGDARRARAMIDAAQAAGVGKFVFISSVTPPGSGLPELMRCKLEAEHHLEASGLDYTVLQSDAFMEVWLAMMGSSIPIAAVEPGLRHTLDRASGFARRFFSSMRHDIEAKGVAHVNGSGQARVSYVATADVARIAVGCLDNPVCRRSKLAVGGEPLSADQVAKIFGKVLGRSVRLRKTPLPVLRLMGRVVGMFDRSAGEMITASAYLANVDSVVDTTRLRHAFPDLRLQTVEEFLRERVNLVPVRAKSA